jgi:ketosteroid isomerase-like protein
VGYLPAIGEAQMSMESENVDILRRAYEAWERDKAADMECWACVLAEDARLKSLAAGAPDMAFTRDRQGKEEVLDYLKGLTDDWEMISYVIDEYIAQGDRVVAIGSTSWRNKKTAKVFSTPKIDIWRLKHGKVTEFSEFYDTAHVLAAAAP